MLIAGALELALWSPQYPLATGWLAAKIVAELVYVVLGHVALKRGRTARTRKQALAGAPITFGYIVLVAISRDPWCSTIR